MLRKSPVSGPSSPGKTSVKTSKTPTTKGARLISAPATSQVVPYLAVQSSIQQRRIRKPRSDYRGKSLRSTTRKFPSEKTRKMKMRRR
jgi:hypothetical protein